MSDRVATSGTVHGDSKVADPAEVVKPVLEDRSSSRRRVLLIVSGGADRTADQHGLPVGSLDTAGQHHDRRAAIEPDSTARRCARQGAAERTAEEAGREAKPEGAGSTRAPG